MLGNESFKAAPCFWKKIKDEFPLIFSIVPLVYVSGPSSATLENDFGAAGDIITPKRSMLSDYLFDAIMIININKSEFIVPETEYMSIPAINIADFKGLLGKRFNDTDCIEASRKLSGIKKSKAKVYDSDTSSCEDED